LPTLKSKYGDLEFTVNIPKWEDQGSFADMAAGSLSVGFICVLETLITAKIADNIADAPTPFDPEMETNALGLSNIVVGIMGGLPTTAVIARTKLNILSGTKGKASQFINGLFCIAICLVALPAFTYMPLAAIGVVLTVTAVRMAPTETLMHLWRSNKTECGLMVFVTVLSVGLDPTYGLILGMVIAFIINADNVAQFHNQLLLLEGTKQTQSMQLDTITPPDMRASCVGAICGVSSPAVTANDASVGVSHVGNEEEGIDFTILDLGISKVDAPVPLEKPAVDEAGLYRLAEPAAGVTKPVPCFEPRGTVTYLNADAMEVQMKNLAKLPEMILSLEKCYYVDVDGSDRLKKMVKRWVDGGMSVIVCGLEGLGKEIVRDSAWIAEMTTPKEDEPAKIECAANKEEGFVLMQTKRPAGEDDDNYHSKIADSPLLQAVSAGIDNRCPSLLVSMESNSTSERQCSVIQCSVGDSQTA